MSDGGYQSQQQAYGVPEDNRWQKKYELERQKVIISSVPCSHGIFLKCLN